MIPSKERPHRIRFAILVATAGLAATAGCATSSPDATGFAQIDTAVVGASFDETWQRVKTALKDQGYLIYTRDKRGLFVAYTEERRRRLVPFRTQFTVTLAPEGDDRTTVRVQTLVQEYGVTLLTHPAWHDRPSQGDVRGAELLAAVQAGPEEGREPGEARETPRIIG